MHRFVISWYFRTGVFGTTTTSAPTPRTWPSLATWKLPLEKFRLTRSSCSPKSPSRSRSSRAWRSAGLDSATSFPELQVSRCAWWWLQSNFTKSMAQPFPNILLILQSSGHNINDLWLKWVNAVFLELLCRSRGSILPPALRSTKWSFLNSGCHQSW